MLAVGREATEEQLGGGVGVEAIEEGKRVSEFNGKERACSSITEDQRWCCSVLRERESVKKEWSEWVDLEVEGDYMADILGFPTLLL